MSAIRIGHPSPLGASVTKAGVNFSVVAPLATRVELLLFASGSAREPEQVIELDPRHRSGNHWHVEVLGVGLGCCYGYRVFGPLQPGGHGFNPSKVLVDPCARALAGWGGYKRSAAVGAIPKPLNAFLKSPNAYNGLLKPLKPFQPLKPFKGFYEAL